ncbi:hypothetical protein PPRY_a1012 [Pseudoalteromonas prydzensis ACAM 620]|nr:hypothetical protein [Pseudoalteromonas prydzensis ACAM 620]
MFSLRLSLYAFSGYAAIIWQLKKKKAAKSRFFTYKLKVVSY